LNFFSFAKTKVTGIQTHKKSLSRYSDTDIFLRVCLYNTHFCIAQVLNRKDVKVIF
jgi:hypothetical protein